MGDSQSSQSKFPAPYTFVKDSFRFSLKGEYRFSERNPLDGMVSFTKSCREVANYSDDTAGKWSFANVVFDSVQGSNEKKFSTEAQIFIIFW